MKVLAIDPGALESAFVMYDGERPLFNKLNNEQTLRIIRKTKADLVLIENLSSYGKPVGRDVFETLIWIGRFVQLCEEKELKYELILRTSIKAWHVGTTAAKDSNVKFSLVEKYAKFDFKHGKGKKDNPDFFYGFKADIWQAFAIAAYYFEKEIMGTDLNKLQKKVREKLGFNH